ncbi:MAG TPA: MlaD family protein [Solirubrobacteraceae bacterium]|nr:MlaD family protein [Solirubrobacteraceae bacterium]HME02372.1 MlaD family protein [Solirubrobacteraceae bacterium]
MSRTRWWRRRDQIPVVELQRSRPVRTGVIVVVLVALVTYFGFTKHIPFKHGFRLNAVFANAINIKAKSPVRIAGVDVGQVSSIQREGNTGVVTMEISNGGLPIHTDATVKIRPRIFLEGNWFVELQPGSPSAPTYSSGGTIPITHTSDPVQLDQVLDALNTDTRANLQTFLIEYGAGLTASPTPEQDAAQDPEVRGINAAQALNKAYHLAPPALRGGAVIQQALTGTDPHDLSKLVAGIGKVTAALNVHEQQLGELIVNFNTFFASLAAQSVPLQATVAELPAVLASINRGLTSLDAAFGPTREFAHAIIPGVKLTPSTVTAVVPFIEQTQASLGPNELGGVAEGLASSIPSLAKLTAEQIPLFAETDQFNKCLTKLIYPAGNTKLQDGTSTTGVENYKEFWYSLVGLAGIGQSFDGNGPLTKFIVGNSGQTLRSGPVGIVGTNVKPGLRLLARSPLQPLGTRPAFPGAEPPYQPLVPCYTQTLPEFNGPAAQGPADGAG